MRVTIQYSNGHVDSFDLNPDGIEVPDTQEVIEHDAREREEPKYGDVITDEPASNEPLNPMCFLCENFIESTQDQYCFGCRTFICSEHPQTPWGPHKPEAHDTP